MRISEIDASYERYRTKGRKKKGLQSESKIHGACFSTLSTCSSTSHTRLMQYIHLTPPLFKDLGLHKAWVALTGAQPGAAVARLHPIPHLLAFQFQGTLTTTKRFRSNNDLLCARTIGSLECVLRLVEPCLRHGASGPAARRVCLVPLSSVRTSVSNPISTTNRLRQKHAHGNYGTPLGDCLVPSPLHHKREEGRAQSVPREAMDPSSETLALRRQLEKAVSGEVRQSASHSRSIFGDFCLRVMSKPGTLWG